MSAHLFPRRPRLFPDGSAPPLRAGCLVPALLALLTFGGPVSAQQTFQKDVVPTSAGDLEITFVGHGTLVLTIGGQVIHVDPVGREADYDHMPAADAILVTHEHGDHLDPEAIARIRRPDTELVASPSCAPPLEGAVILENGDRGSVLGYGVEAVPAYNLVHRRDNGEPYHPKGRGNGYVLTFGDTRVYVAGDTENTPEMKALRDIDVAFLPMNLPYTMTPGMVADAARAFRPRILYPYHYGETDPEELVRLLADEADIEVRIREMR